MLKLITKLKFAGVCAALCVASVSNAQTTLPSSAPAGASRRTQEQLSDEIKEAHNRLMAAVTDPADLSDPARRKAVAPKAIEPLRTIVNDFRELATVQPKTRRRAAQVQLQFMAFLSVLGDQPTIDQLQAMSIGKDPAEALRSQASQLLAKWILAGKDEAATSKLADDVQSLDQAHPDSEDLTFLTVTLSQNTTSAPLSKRLLDMATGMQNPVAANVRATISKGTTKP